METVKVGIAGLGVAAQVVYLPLLARRRDLFRVAAVCDLDRGHAETIGREAGVPAYDDPLAMLDRGGFDALIVLTPAPTGCWCGPPSNAACGCCARSPSPTAGPS